jgi:aminoglycoside phosphotransferase (APT) family kinase protein
VAHIVAALAQSLPANPDVAIVHGDFRIDNIVVSSAQPERVLAVLEWETETIGDPLVDLGIACRP